MLAHHGGVPVEELVLPLVTAGGAVLVAARVFFARLKSTVHRRRSKGS